MNWELFGYAASACFILCGVPQVVLCIKQGHGKGLSHLFMWIWQFGEISLLVYAIFGLNFNIPMFLNSLFCSLICLLILKYLYFPRKHIMKEILLYKSIKHRPTKDSDYIIVGKTIVDDYNYYKFNKYRWSLDSHGYVVRKESIYKNKKQIIKNIYLHREICFCHNKSIIDHINHNPLDNRECNLRMVTTSQNQMNRLPYKNTSSKYKGVCWSKSHNKWLAYIKFNKKLTYLGYFKDEKAAAKAYNEKAKELFTIYTELNLI